MPTPVTNVHPGAREVQCSSWKYHGKNNLSNLSQLMKCTRHMNSTGITPQNFHKVSYTTWKLTFSYKTWNDKWIMSGHICHISMRSPVHKHYCQNASLFWRPSNRKTTAYTEWAKNWTTFKSVCNSCIWWADDVERQFIYQNVQYFITQRFEFRYS